jgi:hypothetical protein
MSTTSAAPVSTMSTMLLMPSLGATRALAVTSAQPRLTTPFLVSLVTTSTMRVKYLVLSAQATTCAHSLTLTRLPVPCPLQARGPRATKPTLVQPAATLSMDRAILTLVQLHTDGLSRWPVHLLALRVTHAHTVTRRRSFAPAVTTPMLAL